MLKEWYEYKVGRPYLGWPVLVFLSPDTNGLRKYVAFVENKNRDNLIRLLLIMRYSTSIST